MLIYKEKFKSKEAISREYYIKKNRKLRNSLKNENSNLLPFKDTYTKDKAGSAIWVKDFIKNLNLE